jgi:peptidoglycan/LPS O-acetylase OafA/YrhL
MGILRFLLAISVVIEHSSDLFGIHLIGGQIAVQSFFIISGFYMALVLNEKYIGINNSYTLFISNRLIRLFPIYWIVLILTILYAIIATTYSNGAQHGRLFAYFEHYQDMGIFSFIFLIFTNIFIFLQDLIVFLGINISSGNLFFTSNFHETTPPLYSFLLVPQAWSIGIEITFYLIAPFIARKNIKFIVILLLLSVCTRYILSINGLSEDPWSYRFFPSELAFFLLGILSYKIYNLRIIKKIKPKYLILILTSIITITLSYEFLSFANKIYAYFALVFLSIPFIFQLTKNWKLDTQLGELSYPIYISHILILAIIRYLNITFLHNLSFTLIIFSIIFSILITITVTNKVEVLRQRRVKKNH